jgi:hypothetical protein
VEAYTRQLRMKGRLAFSVRRSAFGVRRSAFGVRRSVARCSVFLLVLKTGTTSEAGLPLEAEMIVRFLWWSAVEHQRFGMPHTLNAER